MGTVQTPESFLIPWRHRQQIAPGDRVKRGRQGRSMVGAARKIPAADYKPTYDAAPAGNLAATLLNVALALVPIA
jgi:hypothetical protein